MNTGGSISGNRGNHFHKYLKYASLIISDYKGKEPFHLYLKRYFSTNKKHGSNDRKQIASLCYNYFRLGFGVRYDISTEEKFLIGIFLIESEPSPMLHSLRPEWNQKIRFDLFDKSEIVNDVFNIDSIFPLRDELSNEINRHEFNISFLRQPHLFVRVRPGFHRQVVRKLTDAKVTFKEKFASCFSFDNREKITSTINIDKEAVIQDLNSQRVGEFFKSYLTYYESQNVILHSPPSLWDCCAGSGGKSILATDILKSISLTVSDIRGNILKNLKERFAKAGITNYQSFVADLSLNMDKNIFENTSLKNAAFDLIIADVPCSGSGTWSRAPEEMQRFSLEKLFNYASLQKKIVTNVSQYLKKGGYFLYVTCSVYNKENEENVKFIQENLKLELVESKYLKGYEMRADTLFAAMFKKGL